jgi:hypothetical protein
MSGIAHHGHESLPRYRSAGVGDDVDQHLLQVVARAAVTFFIYFDVAL